MSSDSAFIPLTDPHASSVAQEIFISAEGARPRASLLIVPGWKDELTQYTRLAQALSQQGWQSLIVPIPQEARNHQTHRRHMRLLTVAAGRFFHAGQAQAQAGPPHLRCLLGFSYGGFLGALLSARVHLDALLLRSPAMYADNGWDVPKDDLDEGEIGLLRVLRLEPADSQALEAAQAFAGDVLIVECEHDERVPHETHLNYYKAFSAARSRQLHLIEGADHALSDPVRRQAFDALALDWLESPALLAPPERAT